MQRFLAATALLLACAVPASAQATYAAPAGDRLRFRETTSAKLTFSGPQGEIPASIDHRALISVVRMRGDSARAWYDSLSLSATNPGGEMKPATDSALRRPFRLRFDARGRTKLVEAPTFPASFEGLSDLTRQFDDFFLRLPVKPLAIGVAWSDTLVRTDSTADKRSGVTVISDYRVERDTVVNGVRAFVIRSSSKSQISGEGPVPNQPMRAETMLEGTDSGQYLFARTGRLLARRREGRMEGNTMLRGGGGEMAMRQSYTYVGTVDAVR
jgi:hypothetical protein